MKRSVIVFLSSGAASFMFLKPDWLDFFRWFDPRSVSREEFYEKD